MAVAITAARLDRIDKKILKHLQAEGRMPVTDLAAKVNLSVSPCLARVRKLEAHGYIRGYHAELDAALLGLGLLAYVQIHLDRTTPDVFDRFAEAIQDYDEVLECHMVGGGFDYLVKIRTNDMAAFRRFLGECMATVRGVQQTHTYFVMEEVKSTSRVPITL